MRLQHSGEGYWLYIPKVMIESKNWQKGDVFYPVPVENGVTFIYAGKGKDNTTCGVKLKAGVN